MRILIIEDEQKVARFLKLGLEEAHYIVTTVDNGLDGLDFALSQQFELVILDLMLPGRDGLSVLGELRQSGCKIPVLILTARDSVMDKVAGLDSGAEDYLTKPFSFEELLARIRVLLRRRGEEASTVLKVGDLCVDLNSHEVNRNGEPILLTPKEFILLEYMMRNVGRVLTRTLIAEHVWGYDFDFGTNVVDVHVSTLRSKIDRPFAGKLIQTVRGVGYVLKEKK